MNTRDAAGFSDRGGDPVRAHALAADRDRHLLLVTATPHSGIEESFRSLLGLLDPGFEQRGCRTRAGRAAGCSAGGTSAAQLMNAR
jgi:hypothetical protein